MAGECPGAHRVVFVAGPYFKEHKHLELPEWVVKAKREVAVKEDA